jgi:hypothetical protein
MRNITKNLRLTKSEIEYIQQQIDKTNGEFTFTRYMVASALKQKIEIIPPISKEALLLLRRTGNNINQIAMHLNDKKEVYPPQIFQKNQEMIIKLLREIHTSLKNDR